MKIADEIEAVLERSLGRPGLVPVACDGTELADAAELAKVAPTAWAPALLAQWRSGAIYLRDENSKVSPRADISARRVVLRGSTLAAYATIAGDGVLIDRSLVESHAAIEGPALVVLSRLQSHTVIGPYVALLQTGVMPFTKIQRFVQIQRSAIGSHTAIEGGTHPEKLPLGPQRRAFGVTIAADCWIGHHVSISAGAAIAEGVTVAPFTSISRPEGPHVLVMGTPSRAMPIDANIRGLSEEQAVEEGRLQGVDAVRLPVFGAGLGTFAPSRIEIDYPQHGALRNLASEATIHFQRGAIERAFAVLAPDRRATVRHTAGTSIRFTIDLDGALSGSARAALEQTFGTTVRWSDAPLAAVAPAAAAPVVTPAPRAPIADVASTIAAELRAMLPPGSPIDNDLPFYVLGLDSMGVAALAARLEALGLVPPDLFVHNSVAAATAAIEGRA